MLSVDKPEFERNLGFISRDEQIMLHNSTVAIAGAGGDGGMLALQLARLGVGEIRLADPDPFEAQNINRQACCTVDTIGVNKAEAVGSYIEKINPDIEVSLYKDGITQENAEKFVKGSDLVIDETEFTIQSVGVTLARSARRLDIPNMMAMNIGFGATVTSFLPKEGMTFEKMLGLPDDMAIDEVEKTEPSMSRWLPYIPAYGDIDVFKKVASDEKSAPSIAPGVALAAGMAATQAFLHLSKGHNNRPSPVSAPKVLIFDAMTGESKRVSLTRRSHYFHLTKMLVRNSLKLNPKASY